MRTKIALSEKQIEALKEKHEAIRTVLMNNNCDEYGDCIIDEICEVVGILPTHVYYKEEILTVKL